MVSAAAKKSSFWELEKTIFTPYWGSVRVRLTALRQAAGLSQRQLARKLRVDPAIVARIELGQRRVDLVEFVTICRSCGADPDKVFLELNREFKSIEKSNKTSS